MHILHLYTKNKQSEIQNKKYMEVADVCIHLYIYLKNPILRIYLPMTISLENLSAKNNVQFTFWC